MLILNPIAEAIGERTNEKHNKEPKRSNCGLALTLFIEASTALTPKIRTGIYKGKINNEINILPLFKLTVREAPIEPSKISVGVPISIVKVK